MKSASQQQQNLSANSEENKLIKIRHTEKTELLCKLVVVYLPYHFVCSLCPSCLLYGSKCRMRDLCCKNHVVAHVENFVQTLYTQYIFGKYSVPKPNNLVNPKP